MSLASSNLQQGPTTATTTTGSWDEALEHAIPAIIVIRVLAVRAFDGAGASSSYATGFVVDKKRGIICTNRHVITAGMVSIDGILKNKEEITLRPLWRDPVHDYGFLQYDPADIKYMEMTEIELDPAGARQGREIRVVGNDAGVGAPGYDRQEKLQILSGYIARLDRDSPFYGTSTYNDFNTFYISSAASTSGGSSGSPVLTIEGKAAALNCGAAKQAASSFYLPLDRIVRSLALLQSGHPVSRGTLQAIFKHKAYDELRRLGMNMDTEGMIRKAFPDETGMLVVEQVIPKGPASALLEAGDILVEVEGKVCTTFYPLEEALDSNVGGTVTLKILRGCEEKTITFNVQDLHSIIPSEFISISSAIIHPLSYQHAKNYNLPVGLVYIASTGYFLTRAGIDIHAIITSVAGKPTPTLKEFQEVMESFPDGYRTSIQYFGLTDRNRTRTAIITIDRKWFKMSRYVRNDPYPWLCYPSPPPPPPSTSLSMTSPPAKRQKASELSDDQTLVAEDEVVLRSGEQESELVAPMDVGEAAEEVKEQQEVGLSSVKYSLCLINFDAPHIIEGSSSGEFVGAGVIFDKENGLVLADRATVPFVIGDVMVTIGGTVEVPGEVLFVHPIHNFSIIQYSPKKLAASVWPEEPPQIEEANFTNKRLKVGGVTNFFGLTNSFVPVCQKSVVTRIETLKFGDGRPPQFVGANTDGIFFDHSSNTNGIHVDEDGNVAALRICFIYQRDEVKQVYRSVPAEIFMETIDILKGGGAVPRTIPCLPVKFTTVSLAKARAGMGLNDTQYQLLSNKIRREANEAVLLMVRRVATKSTLDGLIETGDVILAIDDIPVVRSFEVELAIRHKTSFKVTVLRSHQEVTVEAKPTDLCTFGTDRVILWSGLMVHNPHLAVRWLGYIPEEGGGVYISRW